MGSHAQKGFYGQNAGFSMVSSPPLQMQSFVPNACNRCGHVGCDLKMKPCGCLFHAVSSSRRDSPSLNRGFVDGRFVQFVQNPVVCQSSLLLSHTHTHMLLLFVQNSSYRDVYK